MHPHAPVPAALENDHPRLTGERREVGQRELPRLGRRGSKGEPEGIAPNLGLTSAVKNEKVAIRNDVANDPGEIGIPSPSARRERLHIRPGQETGSKVRNLLRCGGRRQDGGSEHPAEKTPPLHGNLSWKKPRLGGKTEPPPAPQGQRRSSLIQKFLRSAPGPRSGRCGARGSWRRCRKPSRLK